ncbi:hypothetical protein CAEBREN_15820 [Caenorhabditis brenneri]|uniref:Smr domain-containing protein n=1 Tax=Caenorhabditis brenneri TaxID=135651 RepID=G0NMX3_CAEBE|nr:hypothetical protein CAEBREN_15820 [Caenorhabditis brenneri]
MSRRDSANRNAQYLEQLQKEFKDFRKDENNKENKSSKPNEICSEIVGIEANFLKTFLGNETFFEIDAYVQQLCHNERKAIRSKKFKNIEELSFAFSGTSTYSVRDYWIKHLYHLHDRNLVKTAEALAMDKSIVFGENEKNLLKNNSQLIDHFVRQRNFPVERIGELKPSLLKFELHWFTVDGAKKFVKEVLEKTSGPELHLVTGIGLNSRNKESLIKKMLLDVYQKRIRVCEKNEGILILNVDQNECSVKENSSPFHRTSGRSTHYRLFV